MSIKEYSDQINYLLSVMPVNNSSSGRAKLNEILSRYSSLLDLVSGISNDYSRHLSEYYNEISSIEHAVNQAANLKSLNRSNQAFSDAVNAIRTDLTDLREKLIFLENL